MAQHYPHVLKFGDLLFSTRKCSNYKIDVERLGRQGEPADDSKVEVAGGLQSEILDQGGQNEERLGPGQDLARAFPLPDAESNDAVIPDERSGLGVNEPLRPKLFRLGKIVRVHVNRGERAVDLSG